MIKNFLVSICVCVLLYPTVIYSQKHNNTLFEIKDGNFYNNGKVTSILSGEMHYPRVPHQYWQHRLRMMKAMGLNAVATCVFWNLHEPEPNKWDFEGDKNLAEFIRLAGNEGLMVILRPGPYVCAEWEFGGYPWWLQNVRGMEIRRDNTAFLKCTKRYIDRLYKEVGDLQTTKKGPIVMVQCENEFGSYVGQRLDISKEEHQSYNAKIKQQLVEAGFNVPLFTSDGSWCFEEGNTPGALPTANGENNITALKNAVNKYNKGQGPYMVAEFYPGWLSHWAEPFPHIETGELTKQTELYLKNDISFNYYMVHGGTNFGFTSGANYNKKHDIQPDLTSYDYDAPISEAGWATPKYKAIREVIKKYAPYTIPEIPDSLPIIEIPSIKLTEVIDVLNLVTQDKPVRSDSLLTFEQLGQGSGYMLYTRHFNQPINGTMEIPGLRDYAVVYVDGEKVGVLNRNSNTYSMDIQIPFNATLEILVENMGRINYGSEIVNNLKGIISPIFINGIEIMDGWNMYKLPMSKSTDFTFLKGIVDENNPAKSTKLQNRPVIYKGSFDLTETGDTFINMENWGKGIIFVNGINIGRYWQVGPQQTLYIPGVWLHKGKNEIQIFEQLNTEIKYEINTRKTPIL